MFNAQQITARLASMSDQQLAQYARMHKEDPYVLPLTVSEFKRRQQTRQQAQANQVPQEQPTVSDQTLQEMLPEQSGIGRLPAPNMDSMNMANGGIVAFSGEDGSQVKANPMDQYAPQIIAEAKRLGIEPSVALRLFKAESRGNPNAQSKRGAVGLGQLKTAAAAEMGLTPEERLDPAKNISASLGYFKKQLDRFKDYPTALSAYNWGPGNTNKHLAKNSGELKPIGLPKETRDYINKILPFSAANASDEIPRPTQAKAAAPVAKALASDLPTPEAFAADEKRRKELNPDRSYLAQRGRELLGAPEAAAAMITGAPPINAVTAGLRSLFTGEDINTAAGKTRFEPRSEQGKESLYALGKGLEDTGLDKLPPFMPGVGVSKPRGLTYTEKVAPSEVVAARAAADAANQKTSALRLAAPTTEKPGTIRVTPEGEAINPTGSAADATRRGLLGLAEDQLAAKAAQEKANKLAKTMDENVGKATANRLMNERATALNRMAKGTEAMSPFGAMQTGTGYPGVNVEGQPRPYGTFEENFPENTPTEIPPEAAQVPQDAPQTAKPSGGFTNEDLMIMGLNMMQAPAGQPGGAFSQLAGNIGRSGLATVASRKEREKLAQEQKYKDILAGVQQSQGDYYKAQADYFKNEKSETALRLKAASLVEEGLAKWRTANIGATPEQEAAQRLAIASNVNRELGLLPGGVSPQVAAILARPEYSE